MNDYIIRIGLKAVEQHYSSGFYRLKPDERVLIPAGMRHAIVFGKQGDLGMVAFNGSNPEEFACFDQDLSLIVIQGSPNSKPRAYYSVPCLRDKHVSKLLNTSFPSK